MVGLLQQESLIPANHDIRFRRTLFSLLSKDILIADRQGTCGNTVIVRLSVSAFFINSTRPQRFCGI